MELKNANGWNVVNKQSTSYDFTFFKKYWKLSKIKDFKVCFRVEIP